MNPTVVVCIGDSITHGNRDLGGDPYPDRLQALLGPAYRVVNVGMNGGGIVPTDRQVYRGGEEWLRATTAGGDILVVMLGTNDTAAWNRDGNPLFATAYADFIRELRTLPERPLVVLCTPPPIDTTFKGIDAPHAVIMTSLIVPVITALASSQSLPLIDVFRAMSPESGWLADGVHPNDLGNHLLAKTMHTGLVRIMATPLGV